MFKLGVVSDSHGGMENLRRAAALLSGCNQVVHLGDLAPDANRLSQFLDKPVLSVKGNCDFLDGAPEEMTLTMEGVKVLLCHGHFYQVKNGLLRLGLRAREAEAKLVLFGHTHVSLVQWDGDILFVNPGALMNGKYAVVEFRENGPTPFIKNL